MLHNNFSNINDKYSKLKALIEERQSYEAVHSYPPYSTHKTDINFTDVNGNTLLHYAAILGDMDKIVECINHDSDINLKDGMMKSAIELALTNGNLEAADYLYKNGANCVNLKLEICKDEKQAQWLIEKIRQAFDVVCPDPFVIISCDHAIQNQFFPEGIHFRNTLLDRAVEIEHIEFIKNHISDYSRFLLTASTGGSMTMMQYLINGRADINNGGNDYHETPFINAIRANKNQAIDYLLSFQGLDINKQDSKKFTPLMHAILQNNHKLVCRLIELNADVARKNINGDTILHCAAQDASCVLPEVLLNNPDISDLLNHKNIFGQTPRDVAIENKNDACIKLFSSNLDMEKIKTDSKYGVKQAAIAQHYVMQKILYFLKLNYRDTTHFSPDGHCNGFTFLEELYASREMDAYYFDTMALISAWDGEQSSLLKPFGDIHQATYYANLYELFEQWINDIIWFQHSTILGDMTALSQASRFQQYQLVKNKREDDDIQIVYSGKELFRNTKQLTEIYSYLMRMPNHIHVEIHGAHHVASVSKSKFGLFSYYDSNILFKTTEENDSYKNMKRMIDYKYIASKRFMNDRMDCSIYAFYFKRNIHPLNLNDFIIFRDEEFPKSREEALQFQLNSPNKFTHLHVAVMTRSLSAINRILKDKFCDPYAKNVCGQSALEMAEESQFEEAVKIIRDSIDIDLISGHQASIMVL
jgi:ankyrin repeat protein